MRHPLLPLLAAAAVQVAAQAPVNGPMPGHCDLLETTVWMQCHGPCAARLEYWKEGRPDSTLTTAELASEAATGHVLKFTMDQVVPGTRYGYRVILDGKALDMGEPLFFHTQPLWKFRSDPPPFTLATGSCAYINEPPYDRPGTPYGGEYGIFDAIADQHPDLMLWLGDNIYLREPDWGSRTGYIHRYTHMRGTPELQRLLRGTHHYAIWDDHDFGPNDADAGFVNAPLALEMFELFWANPTTGAPGVPGAITAFSYEDVDLFLLDDRTYRVPPDVITAPPAMLGDAQIDWLIRALKYSDASFKLVAVGGQVLSTADVFENMATFPAERDTLLARVRREGLTDVIFLTGDRHFTELSRWDPEGGPVVYDLTVSPLTSGPYTMRGVNDLQVPGTLVEQRNFATLRFDGPLKERIMTIRVHDVDGEVLWERKVQRSR